MNLSGTVNVKWMETPGFHGSNYNNPACFPQ